MSSSVTRGDSYQAPARNSSSDLQIQANGSKPDSKAVFENIQRAASDYFEENLNEQKMWIQCTLKAAKGRGEDWIDSVFNDEKHANSGCTACLPDIVVVNETENSKDSHDFQSKAPAPWQRVWNLKESNLRDTSDSITQPAVSNSMPSAAGAYLYDEKRYHFVSCSTSHIRLLRKLTPNLQVVHLVSVLVRLDLHVPHVPQFFSRLLLRILTEFSQT